MTSEESMDSGPRDQFPVGMRVLAVDDDPICLKLLETLLLRCQYHVTITNQAIKALKLLRENKAKFDLVISDVHMPDMDGFRLLEFVGLEMDLPVIMLSANGETETVMKGITHGAVDYLLKPVRIEALRNIWQHVIRRRKFDHRDHNNLDNGEECERSQNANHEGGQGAVGNGSSNYNAKHNRKRKDQNEEDEDDCEENMHENEDSSQKKPRIVWSIELHRKFVAAVNHLGIDKAVPKRILDLMNVERLTRENVASHLQKYRLYLKRLSAVASQQATMVAALGGRDLSYLPMYSLNGFGNFHATGQAAALSSYQPNGMLDIASPAALGMQVLGHSGIVHFGHTHNTTSHPINDLNKLQHTNLTGNQHGNLLRGIPMSSELDKFQQQKRMPVANNHLPGALSGSGLATGSSGNSFINVTDSHLLLQGQQQHMKSRGLTNHSSHITPPMSSDPFERIAGVSSYSPDLGRCNDTFQGAVPLNGYTIKTSPMVVPSTQDDLAPSIAGSYAIPMPSHLVSSSLNISSSCVVVAPQHDLVIGRDGQCQTNCPGRDKLLVSGGNDEDTKFSNFRSKGHSRQNLEEPEKDHFNDSSLLFSSSLNCPLPNHILIDSTAENQKLNNGLHNKNIDTSMMSQSAPLLTQSCKVDNSTSDAHLNYNNTYTLEAPKLTRGLNSLNFNGCYFDDPVNAMIKTEQDDVTLMDGNMGYDGDMEYDIFPLGTCM